MKIHRYFQAHKNDMEPGRSCRDRTNNGVGFGGSQAYTELLLHLVAKLSTHKRRWLIDKS
jgi:hypothetical protein